MDEKQGEVTRLLLAWTDGDAGALEQLMPLVYDELRRIAKGYMDRERPDHTLQPTAVVHEVYLRLVDRRKVNWRNRAHFFGTTAEMMRRILVDHARKRLAQRRGGNVEHLTLDEARDAIEKRDLELIALDDALRDLKRIHPRQASVVELSYFAGLTYKEIGEVLGVSEETVKRDFRAARAWLHEHMHPRALKDLESVGATAEKPGSETG